MRGKQTSCLPLSLYAIVFVSVLLSVNGEIAIPSPVRLYTFDAPLDFTDKGTDGEPLAVSSGADVIGGPDCRTGSGGCLRTDMSTGTALVRTTMNWTTYDAMTVCFWNRCENCESEGVMPWRFVWGAETNISFDNSLEAFSLVMPDDTAFHPWYPTAVVNAMQSDTTSRDSWNHACVAVAAGKVTTYRNGALTPSATIAGPLIQEPSVVAAGSAVQLYLGMTLDGSPQNLEWWYDDFQIFDVDLDAGQVAAVYAQTDASRSNSDANVCNSTMLEQCPQFSSCSRSGNTFSCSCLDGYVEEDEGLSCVDVNECAVDSQVQECNHLAYCDNTVGSYECTCPEGFFGDGISCQSDSFSVRSVCSLNHSAVDIDWLKLQYARVIMGDASEGYNQTREFPIVGTNHIYVHVTGDLITINALFESQNAADTALRLIDRDVEWGAEVQGCVLVDGPEVYRWTGRSAGDPIEVGPSGFTLEDVFFQPDCLAGGCWVVDTVYTTGTDDFNAFFVPRAVGDDTLSYDFDYSVPDVVWAWQSAEDTFDPITHPCTSADYDASSGLLAQVTSCCLPQFLAMYRPMQSFVDAVQTKMGPNCGVGARDRALGSADVHEFANGELPGDEDAPAGVYVSSVFSGMRSYGEPAGVVDPYIGIYKARFYLDELELRGLAGQLRGTVGVEHSVDTFLGLLNLSPTGSYALDSFVTQAAIHLEKTSFFSVSTQGTNDYTFLEYVNVRLVTVYLADIDFTSQPGEETARSIDTPSVNSADYVQVTFSLGTRYEVNENSGLVPLDTVRAGLGTFAPETTMMQKCLDYTNSRNFDVATFDSRFQQACAPAPTMCSSPSSIPDQFVSYNVPLGIDFLPEQDLPTDSEVSLSVFVAMVISATVKAGFRDDLQVPNAGGDPFQMKSTLSATIPLAEGGTSIFCDGLVSKTDLQEVANADIVVGTASSIAEWSRLRIAQAVASTQLYPGPTVNIDTDSVEAALMTLVVKGAHSYFKFNSQRNTEGVSLELEDVVTIHIMQSAAGSAADASLVAAVGELLGDRPDNNRDSNGLNGADGYWISNAFFFTLDRGSMRSHLEPSDALLALCPFTAARPPTDNVEIESCITRRDVRYRRYPARAGSVPTAMEICASVNSGTGKGVECTAGAGSGSACCTAFGGEQAFLSAMLGDNDYTKQLAQDFTALIADQYELNHRYRRAFWINPGYEWTPTQTGGRPLFSISQYVYMFALVAMDEGLASSAGNGFQGRRRMLLQAETPDSLKEAQAGLDATLFEFPVTTTSMLASAFDVPEDRVASFGLTMQLTHSEACLDTVSLQAALRESLAESVQGLISPYHTLQVAELRVDRSSVQCTRRSTRRLLRSKSFSPATAAVTMIIVFVHEEGIVSHINIGELAESPGIQSIELLGFSDVDTKVDGFIRTPPQAPPADARAESSGPSTTIIAAACGAVGFVLVVAVGVLAALRAKTQQKAAEAPITSDYLKSEVVQEL